MPKYKLKPTEISLNSSGKDYKIYAKQKKYYVIDQNSDVASLGMTQVLFAGFEYKNRFERAFDGGTDYYEKKRHMLEMKRLETEKKQVELQNKGYGVVAQ